VKEILSFKPNLGTRITTKSFLFVVEILLSLLIGLGFIALGAGSGAWILGGIVSGAIAFYFYRSRWFDQAEPNRKARKLGQVLVGLTLGFSVHYPDLIPIAPQLPIFALLVIFLLASSAGIGYFYSWLGNTDLLTAVLATVPGNIGVMASIAADHRRNIQLVSLVQLIRFTTLILIIPLLINVSSPHGMEAIASTLSSNRFSFDPIYSTVLVFVLAITMIAVHLLDQSKQAFPAFFSAILIGILFNGFLTFLAPALDFNLPPFLNLIGQILLGITIGEYWGMNFKIEKRALVCAIAPVTLTILVGLIAAGIAKVLTVWDWLTCLLVTAPGGSPEMILIALVLHHNVEVVTTGHLIRLMMINLTLPALIALTCFVERYFSDRADTKNNIEASTPTGS
jgi:uncharacterized protein